MELLSPLRLLARRRLLLVLGILFAAAIGAAASGYRSIGPLGSPETRSAIATADVQIDTPRPLAADLRANAATIAEQAIMVAERLTGDDARTVIAQRAGVPLADLAVVSSRTAIAGRTSPVARAAVKAFASTPSRFRLTVTSNTVIPIVSVVAAAPDRATAARLAAAAAPAAQLVIAAAPATVPQRLEARSLAPPRTGVVVAGGPKPLLGVIGALLAFVGWCWIVVVAGGVVRLWRTGTTDRPLTSRA